MNKLRGIIVLLGVAVLLVAGLSLFGIIQHIGKTKLNIVVLPHDSTLTIDGTKAKEGNVYLRTGAHTIKAQRQDFEDYTKKIDTKGIVKNQVLYAMPKPVSEAAINYLKQNPKVQAEREAAGGAQDETITTDILNNYPIIKLLPYSTVLGPFSINYAVSPTNSNTYVIQISDSSTGGRVKALQWIKDQGFDPTDYRIQFLDTKNPFTTGATR